MHGAPGSRVDETALCGAGRFECRWAQVSVLPSPAVMLEGMAGSTMGIWVAHGEGRCHFPDEQVEQLVLENDLAPVRYADADGRTTSSYPANPNGSPHSIAALCSADGRHLAMMPHPERCVLRFMLCCARCAFPVDVLLSRGPRKPLVHGVHHTACICRCYLGWQVPWHPPDVRISEEGPGPWLKLFQNARTWLCLLYTSPSPRDRQKSRMPSSA